MTRRTVAALATGALTLTSCSSPLTTEQYLPEPAALRSAVDCSTATGWEPPGTAPASLLKGSIPAGFVTAEVVRCTLPDIADGQVQEEHLGGDYAPLLAALAVSSERGPASCLDYGEILPAIWLVNASGQAVNIQWPMDSCQHSLPETAKALNGLTVISTRNVPLQESVS